MQKQMLSFWLSNTQLLQHANLILSRIERNLLFSIFSSFIPIHFSRVIFFPFASTLFYSSNVVFLNSQYPFLLQSYLHDHQSSLTFIFLHVVDFIFPNYFSYTSLIIVAFFVDCKNICYLPLIFRCINTKLNRQTIWMQSNLNTHVLQKN